MIPFDTILMFIGAAAALAIVPGPDNIFVLTQSALHGRAAGLIITLGLACGLLVHTTAAAFGVAVIVQTSQLAFAVLKYAGAAYLLYLAWGAFTAKVSPLSSESPPRTATKKLLLRGFIMNITNPKVTIFMLAFLPQFVEPNHGSLIGQFYQLGGLMFLVTLLVFGGIALAAGTLGSLLSRSPKVQIWLNRLSGLVFVTLALKLATAEK